MSENNRIKKIAIMALFFAVIAIGMSDEGIDGINGTNSVMGSVTYILHNTSSDVTTYSSLKMDSVIVADIPKTTRLYSSIPNGDTLVQNWTSLSINLTLIPAGVVDLHIHAKKIGVSHEDRLWFDVGIVNSTGGNFTSIGISYPYSELLLNIEAEYTISGIMLQRTSNYTDRMAVRLYINQTGVGGNPDMELYMDDLTISRVTFPAIPIDLTSLINNIATNANNINLKVNKTGDTMTGTLTATTISGTGYIWGSGVAGGSTSAVKTVGSTKLFYPVQAATAPTYSKGALFFNTTDNKLYVGGATTWERVTSI